MKGVLPLLNITPRAKEKLQELLAEKEAANPFIRIYFQGFG
jgi:Fe-S cluster assembly iron-binding protein IscA